MDEQIAQFVAITGLDSAKAKFYVESAKGDVETALSTFYETEGGQDGAEGDDVGDDMVTSEAGHASASAAAPSKASDEAAAAYTGPRTLSGAPAPAGSSTSSWGKQASSSKSSSAARAGSGFSASGGIGGIATLRDMRNDEDDDDDGEEDENGKRKKPAHLFTGGEKSGLNVQNPDSEKDDGPEVVQNILKKAAEGMRGRGGEEGGGQSRAAPSQSSFAFTGRGRSMGGPSEEEEAAAESATPQRGPQITSEYLRALRSGEPLGSTFGSGFGGGEDDDDDDEEDEIATRHITFWQDGFSIEDGPLCRYDDPQHAETLALINSNRAPLHLLNVKFGQRVDLQVEKKTHKKYQPPPPKPMKAFEGQGNRLGAPAPSMSSAPAAAPAPPAASSASTSSAPATSSSFEVNPNEPTTRVQIRLGDGQKLVAKFNHTHTVADIRRYINASQPGMAERAYSLQASFPPKPLTDEEQTLSDVGLINSVVTQKWE